MFPPNSPFQKFTKNENVFADQICLEILLSSSYFHSKSELLNSNQYEFILERILYPLIIRFSIPHNSDAFRPKIVIVGPASTWNTICDVVTKWSKIHDDFAFNKFERAKLIKLEYNIKCHFSITLEFRLPDSTFGSDNDAAYFIFINAFPKNAILPTHWNALYDLENLLILSGYFFPSSPCKNKSVFLQVTDMDLQMFKFEY